MFVVTGASHMGAVGVSRGAHGARRGASAHGAIRPLPTASTRATAVAPSGLELLNVLAHRSSRGAVRTCASRRESGSEEQATERGDEAHGGSATPLSTMIADLVGRVEGELRGLVDITGDNLHKLAYHVVALGIVAALGIGLACGAGRVPPALASEHNFAMISPPQLVAEVSERSAADQAVDALIKGVSRAADSALDAVDVALGAGSANGEKSEELLANQEVIKEVWGVVDQNFLDARKSGFDRAKWRELKEQALSKPLPDRNAAYRAVRTMLSQGVTDPYTRFLTPQEFSNLAKYDVTGIGLNLGTAEEFARKVGDMSNGRTCEGGACQGGGLRILGLVKGSSAEAVGMRQGDELLEVDQASVSGRSAFEAASLIQGGDETRGRVVAMRIRHVDGSVDVYSVDRPAVKPIKTPVQARMEQVGGVGQGYVRLSEFNAYAERDVAAAIGRLEREGAQQYVLDLRDNPGGLVQAGIEIARLFLSPGDTIVYTEGRGGYDSATRASGKPLTTAPLSVLVNGRTASASEILAGALRDNCRAALVGSNTFGKGLIQSVYELYDGSGLVLTVGKYVTPAGTDIDKSGIRPDFGNTPAPEVVKDTLKVCTRPSPRVTRSTG